jgi:hypothetical protein
MVPFMARPRDKQERAMTFLQDNCLKTPEWLIDHITSIKVMVGLKESVVLK